MQTIRFEQLGIQSGERLLDLGCGEGRHTLFAYYFSHASYIIGLDINPKDALKAKQKIESFDVPRDQKHLALMVGDGLALPFPDASFDTVVCSEVLEHIPNYEEVLNEIQRILKPGGKLAISVPRYWPEQICWWLSQEYHQVEGGHVRIFSARSLNHKIQQRGFQHQRSHWAHALHSPYWWLRCLFGRQADQRFIVKMYHRFLVWDLMSQPKLTRILEQCLNPLMGKSVVMYFAKK